MQRFSFFVVCFICTGAANAAGSAYLPVVDVSRGGVSARAAFGEEIVPVAQRKDEDVVRVPQKTEKKVVARVAKKSVENNFAVNGDVLRPNRPRSDLWARAGDEPLRMPRMDEIAVIDSDALLPEESIESSSAVLAKNDTSLVTRDEALNELKQLRAEIARLSQLQQESFARARPVTVRTPIAGESRVKPATENRAGTVQREVVPMTTEKEIVRERLSKNVEEPVMASVKEMSSMSPNELKKAFKKTYLSENKHLSTYEAAAAGRYDTISDMGVDIEGFSAARDLSEMDAGVRPMEIKISFLNGDSGLSRDNYNLLSETASIVVNNPKRAVQIAIPESATHNKDSRKLAARRLAIVEQVLRDTGISEQRIVPVLSQRDDDVFVLRIISGDTFESLTQQKRNMFGDGVSKKTYKSMSW
jgi:hypothetical protein